MCRLERRIVARYFAAELLRSGFGVVMFLQFLVPSDILLPEQSYLITENTSSKSMVTPSIVALLSNPGAVNLPLFQVRILSLPCMTIASKLSKYLSLLFPHRLTSDATKSLRHFGVSSQAAPNKISLEGLFFP